MKFKQKYMDSLALLLAIALFPMLQKNYGKSSSFSKFYGDDRIYNSISSAVDSLACDEVFWISLCIIEDDKH